MRIETGALQINNDWTGLFIGGDDALALRELLADVYRESKLDEDDYALVYKYIAIIDCHVDVNYKGEREVQKIECEE